MKTAPKRMKMTMENTNNKDPFEITNKKKRENL